MVDDPRLPALTRQTLIATTLVEVVDTIVGDFDVIDVLTALSIRCGEMFGAAATGIMLVDDDRHLRLIAASSEQPRLIELFQIQDLRGPCRECLKTGQAVIDADLAERSQWPKFAAESVDAGYRSVCAVPLRLKGNILGCLNLFMSEPAPLSDADVVVAQAFADVASITVVQDQATRGTASREGRLQHALDSRIVIEQAKGMIAERGSVDMHDAFSLLRNFARSNRRGLTEVAAALVAGRISVGDLGHRQPPAPPSTEE